MARAKRSARRINIFFSSPRDASEDCKVALDAVRSVQAEFPDTWLYPYAWDSDSNDYPLLATRSPQASVNEAVPTPSQCDIVVVILWSRIGTPLRLQEFRKDDGSAYASGTEWEFEDARRAAALGTLPRILVYWKRDQAVVTVDEMEDADKREEIFLQRRQVREFIQRARDNRLGINEFKKAEFRDLIMRNLKYEVSKVLELKPATEIDDSIAVPQLWTGSPFPGLRSFTDADASIYVGREHEVDELADRVIQWPLVAVVGASGSGKSSLLGAGLLRRLDRGGIEWLLPTYNGSRWTGLYFAAGEITSRVNSSGNSIADPVLALTTRIAELADLDGDELYAGVRSRPVRALQAIKEILGSHQRALVVIDQFEELFDKALPAELRETFVSILTEFFSSGIVRVVVSIRADYFDRWVQDSTLTRLLAEGRTYPLAAPNSQLRDMIVKPAALAGLSFEPGLVNTILDDLGSRESSLPLLAYTLQLLYNKRTADNWIKADRYEAMGGVAGAIGEHAGQVFRQLDAEARESFSEVFGELTEVDERFRVLGRRCELEVLASNAPARRLIDAFTEARLLSVSSEGSSGAVVKIAHDALFNSWPHLRQWLDERRDHLRVISGLRGAATEWNQYGRQEVYLWSAHRLKMLDAAAQLLSPVLDDTEQSFINESRTASSREEQARQQATLYRQRLQAEAPIRYLTAANALLHEDARLAVLLAREALQLKDTAGARQTLRRAVTSVQGAEDHVLREHQSAVQHISSATVGDRWVTSGEDGTCLIWDDGAATFPVCVVPHPGPLVQAHLLDDGSVVSETHESTVRRWSTGDKEGKVKLRGEWSCATSDKSVKFHIGARIAAVVDLGGVAWLLNLEQTSECYPLPGDVYIHDLAFSPDGNSIIAAGAEGAVVWRLSFGGWARGATIGPAIPVEAVACGVPDRVATAASGSLLVHRRGIGESVDLALDGVAQYLEFSPDGRWLLAMTFGEVVVWDCDHLDLAPTWRAPYWARDYAWAPAGHQLAVATSDHRVHLVDLESAALTEILEHAHPIEAISYSCDGSRLWVGDYTGLIHKWSTSRQQLLIDAQVAVPRELTEKERDDYLIANCSKPE